VSGSKTEADAKLSSTTRRRKKTEKGTDFLSTLVFMEPFGLLNYRLPMTTEKVDKKGTENK